MFLSVFFLSWNVARAALPGDLNSDGNVSISEVQATINAFLGFVPYNPNLNKATVFKTLPLQSGDANSFYTFRHLID